MWASVWCGAISYKYTDWVKQMDHAGLLHVLAHLTHSPYAVLNISLTDVIEQTFVKMFLDWWMV